MLFLVPSDSIYYMCHTSDFPNSYFLIETGKWQRMLLGAKVASQASLPLACQWRPMTLNQVKVAENVFLKLLPENKVFLFCCYVQALRMDKSPFGWCTSHLWGNICYGDKKDVDYYELLLAY